MHLVSSHANDVGLTALNLDPLPRGPARADVAETFYLVDLADSALAAELKEAGKAVVYQVSSSSRRKWVARLLWLSTVGGWRAMVCRRSEQLGLRCGRGRTGWCSWLRDETI